MFRKIRDRFTVEFKNQDGHKFRGELGDPNATPRPRKEVQNLPHRSLVTSRLAIAKEGDLVTYYGVQALLLGQHTLGDTKRFLAVEINDHVKWTRVSDIIDPVTKMTRGDAEQVMDPALPVIIEPQRSVEEARFAQSQYRLFTAGDIKEGDVLKGMRIIRVESLMGVKVAELI